MLLTVRKCTPDILARELDVDVRLPTEVDDQTEIMKRTGGLMVFPVAETAAVSATVIMALQSTRKLRRVVEEGHY